jgi:hypothetical protein
MTTYRQYNDAYSNNENESLDQMARQMNNERKKLHKHVQAGFNKQNKETCIGINCLMDSSNGKFAPPNLVDNFGFFSAQGDFSSNLPTPLQKKYSDSNSSKFSDNSSVNTFNTKNTDNTFIINDKYSDSDTNDQYNSTNNQYKFSDSNLIESDISSNYSSLPQKIKKHLRSTTNHLKKYDEKDDKNTINHLKSCSQCRTELLNLLQEEQYIFDNDKQHVKQTNGILNLSTPELKDILILILIGVFIIILFDVFIRR